MATAITRAFEHWNAEKVVNGEAARPDTIVFAHIPGLDPSVEIDRDAGLPVDEYIVYRVPVAQYGVVNENAVAYSVVLDTFVGDFDFNYLGLLHTESNTLCMVVHTMTQKKIATAGGNQGNSFTRTFLMEFNGAAESSQINVTAETWQIDYSARLKGIDESVRLTNLDYYGPAAFIGDGFKVTKEGEQYRIAAGVGYVGGLRVSLADDLLIDQAEDKSIWVDVALKGTVLGAHIPDVKILLADSLVDYVDQVGQHHYVAKLAVDTGSEVINEEHLSPIQIVEDALKVHAESRDHPDATLTKPGFVVLSNATNSNVETKGATPKAVKAAYDLAESKVLKVNGKAADEGKNVTITAGDVGAIPAATGGHYAGAISATYTESTAFGEQYYTAAPFYNNVSRAPNSEFWPVLKQRFHIPGHSAYTYAFGVLNGGDGSQHFNLHIKGSGDQAVGFTWHPAGDSFAPASVRAGAHVYAAYHVYAGGGSAYLRNDGMIAGPVWGDTLSGYLYRNFVTSIRRGSQQYVRPPDWTTTYEVPDGYMTGFDNHTNDGNLRFCGWYFRVTMYNISGWVNAVNA